MSKKIKCTKDMNCRKYPIILKLHVCSILNVRGNNSKKERKRKFISEIFVTN